MTNRGRSSRGTGRSNGIPTALVLVLILGGFGFLLLRNSDEGAPLRAIIPTQVAPTPQDNPWQDVLRDLGDESTVAPTIAIPTQPYVPPTLPVAQVPTITPLSASELSAQNSTVQPGVIASVPTLPITPGGNPAFSVGPVTEIPATVQTVPTPNLTWQPPPLLPPLNRDPQGRDHYFFIRPVDSNAQNYGITYYAYGSDGQQEDNPLRVHHGIDISNPIGQPIRAGLSGTVIFASSPEDPYFQNTFSYGNVVVIEHDYGWVNNGVSYRLFTLYAHLQEAVVETGERVETGQAIGINGNTGQVTGPHVHFEIRLTSAAEGIPLYGDTYNPLLWMVPYVGHGTVAGRLIDENGDFLDDYDITLRNVATTLLQAATTTYIFDDTINQVNPDPNWNENFVFGDVPVGRYEVIANYRGERLAGVVTVVEGMTSFIELKPGMADVAQSPSQQPAAVNLPLTPIPATPPGR
jgi:murein DD-endopeptidase MepM/ murein hydrolase activator NlpD